MWSRAATCWWPPGAPRPPPGSAWGVAGIECDQRGYIRVDERLATTSVKARGIRLGLVHPAVHDTQVGTLLDARDALPEGRQLSACRVPNRMRPRGMSTNMDAEFWSMLDTFVDTGTVVVDRPRGTRQPYVYPLDHGYVKGSTGGDGKGVDVRLGTGGSAVTGVICTFDPYRRNAELKVLWGVTALEIGLLVDFYVPQPQAALALPRKERRLDGGRG